MTKFYNWQETICQLQNFCQFSKKSSTTSKITNLHQICKKNAKNWKFKKIFCQFCSKVGLTRLFELIDINMKHKALDIILVDM